MKIKGAFICFWLVVATRASAQWVVIDVANLQQSVLNYAALAEQISRQATQISNQVRQIQQFETQLKRLGDMSSYTRLAGFSELRADLDIASKIQTWADLTSAIDGDQMFGDTRLGIYASVTIEFPNLDGEAVGRDPTSYRASRGITAAVDEFQAVQDNVYTRRDNLRRAIAATSEALQAATTEAEQQKLDSVLTAQYGELAAIDTEIGLSAAQVQVKVAEDVAMESAQNTADAEVRKHVAQQEAKKISAAFKPQYESLLQYVSEKRFTP